MTVNADLATQAAILTPKTSGLDRSAALCAAVALRETRTVQAALRVLAEWDGPAHIKTAAADLISQLERKSEVTP